MLGAAGLFRGRFLVNLLKSDVGKALVVCHALFLGLAVFALATVHSAKTMANAKTAKPWLTPKRLIKPTRIFNRDNALGVRHGLSEDLPVRRWRDIELQLFTASGMFENEFGCVEGDAAISS